MRSVRKKRRDLNESILEIDFKQALKPFSRSDQIDDLLEASKAFQKIVQGFEAKDVIKQWKTGDFDPKPDFLRR